MRSRVKDFKLTKKLRCQILESNKDKNQDGFNYQNYRKDIFSQKNNQNDPIL